MTTTTAQTRVQALLDELTASGEEIGLQAAAYLDGRLVVNAWSGTANLSTGRPLAGDTLIQSMSTGKGVAATAVHVLVDRGVLAYDDPVARYWPEYGTHGKERTTLAHVLTHSAGVPHLPEDITPAVLADLETVGGWLAGQEPVWEPGTRTGYHGWTFGFLVGEIVRRASGRSIDEVVRDEIARPLGVEGELLFAVPDEVQATMARLYDGGWEAWLEHLPAEFFRCAPRQVLPTAELGNRPNVLRASIPANGTMTARAAARMYAALAGGGELDGVRILSAETLAPATALRTAAPDRTLGFPVRKALGYFLGGEHSIIAGGDAAFGMTGSGGSVAFADPERRFAFALTKNRMTSSETERRVVEEVLAGYRE